MDPCTSKEELGWQAWAEDGGRVERGTFSLCPAALTSLPQCLPPTWQEMNDGRRATKPSTKEKEEKGK